MLSLSGRILDTNEPLDQFSFRASFNASLKDSLCLLELWIEFRRQASFTTAFARNTSPLSDFPSVKHRCITEAFAMWYAKRVGAVQ